MADRIEITPEELRQAADFLDTSREEISEKITSVETKVNDVADNWKGAAQSTFIDGFTNDMLPLLKNDFPSVLEGIAAQLRGAADAIEAADDEVASAFSGN